MSIAAVLRGLSTLTHANELLAAFAGGITLATTRLVLATSLRQLGRPVSKGAAFRM